MPPLTNTPETIAIHIATTSQTVGPFFSIGLAHFQQDNLASPGVLGERITIEGRVLNGDAQPVPDALLELWQANSHGKYAHPADTQHKPLDPAFQGFGRIPTTGDGKFRFTTIKPGAVPGPDGTSQAPHIVVSVFARGLLRRLVTRLYFPDDPANDTDYVLNLIPVSRRATLIAQLPASPPSSSIPGSTLLWNIILQGLRETVFFDC